MRGLMKHETFSVLPPEGQGGTSSPRLKQGASVPLGLVKTLGVCAFAEASTEGKAMTWEKAVAFALEEPGK